MKRIPKRARPEIGSLLQDLIRKTLSDLKSNESWNRLFAFAPASLSRPGRGGKSRNLTSSIIKQARAFETGLVPPTTDSVFIKHKHSRVTKQRHSADQIITNRASAKLEEGDVIGAMRLLSSMDKLATPDAESYNSRIALHPKSPVDRRSGAKWFGFCIIASQFSRHQRAISSFPNGSASGPDGIRPQHLKDLLLGRTDDDPLLLAITDLINALLDGKVPAHVRAPYYIRRHSSCSF